MFITTKLTVDLDTGAVLEREGYEYDGPLALCDRAAHSTAQNIGNQATAGAQDYGTNAAAIGTPLKGFYTGLATAPPGFGANLPGMMGNAAANAAANTGNARQSAQLRAMRTGNAAGQGGVDVAAAQTGGQNETGAIQGILGQNAQLQQQQMQTGLAGLAGLYGTNVNAQLGMLGAGNNAADAMANASKSGWLQNMTGLMGAAGSLAGGGSAFLGALRK